MEVKNNNLDLNKIEKELKIDWTNFTVIEWDILGDFDCPFEITPLEFLNYAKEDLKLKSNKGLIDAMSNAKRSIECQIDIIIIMLGYDYKKFDNSKAYLETKQFIKKFFNQNNVEGLTDRIKLLQILDITPTFLISKIRNLRNKVEHEYIIPSLQDVKEAIEIADLFIHSSLRKTSLITREITFGNNYKEEDINKGDFGYLVDAYICFEIEWYQEGNNSVKLTFVRGEQKSYPYSSNNENNSSYYIDSENLVYPYILKSIYTQDYTLLAFILGREIEEKYIKYTLKHL